MLADYFRSNQTAQECISRFPSPRFASFLFALIATSLLGACGSATSTEETASGGTGGESSSASGGGDSGQSDSGGGAAGTGATAGGDGDGDGDGGGPTLFEPDPDEPCTPDPLADRWIVSELPEVSAGNLAGFGGGLVAVVQFFEAGNELHVGRVDQAAVTWDEPLLLGSSDVQDIHVSPDGSLVLLEILEKEALHLAYLQGDDHGAGLQEVGDVAVLGGATSVSVAMLSGGRAVLTVATSDGLTAYQFTPEGGISEAGTTERYMRGAHRAGGDTVAMMGAPSLIESPHGYVTYEWDADFGEVEQIPAVLERDHVWMEGFRAFPGEVAFRGIRLWAVDGTEGTYLHTRTNGHWDAGRRMTFEVSAADDWLAVSFAGEEGLFYDTQDGHLSVSTHRGGSWSDKEQLPRAREVYLQGMAGDVGGTALVVGNQQLRGEGASAQKIYRRGADGTWYCPRLEPNPATTQVYGNDEGGFAVIQSSYSTAPRVILFPG